MRRMTLGGGLALAASAFTLTAAPVAGATTYNNDTPIIIPDQGNANQYPSSITVSGTAGPITDVNVGLDGLTHSSTNDVAIALVAPSGQALKIQDCVGDGSAGAFITFDDAAANDLPDLGSVSTGTFRPTSHCVATAFPAPGPLSAYGNPGPAGGGVASFATVFNGLSAIGTWNLYVFDKTANAASGSIPGGWSLDVKPDVTPPPAVTPPPIQTLTPAPASKCKKKKKKRRGASTAACKKKKRKK